MVGDRKHDITAAHEHNIPAIGVLWGIGSEKELLTAGADALAQTTAELATLLAPSQSRYRGVPQNAALTRLQRG
jgi:phosphoglycolate phosphatase